MDFFFEEYDNYLKEYLEEKIVINEKLKSTNIKSVENKFWINKFKKVPKINKINKRIIDELVDDIIIYKDGNLKIIFKYKDEYNETLNFINEHKCDIMCKELLKT